jgi:hypothetical protein
MNDDLFYEINSTPDYLEEVRNFSKTAEWTWVPFMNISINFQNTLGKKISKSDIFLSNLQTKFSGTLRLYMFPRMTVYNWHRDSAMGCSLNLVMEDYNSSSLFTRSNQSILNEVIQLPYKKNTWYLFNSQILHSVVNLDQKDRILLTFTFPKNVSYDEVLSYIKSEE